MSSFLSSNKVFGVFFDLSINQFMVDLQGSFGRSREVSVHFNIMRSEGQVLVDDGFDGGIDILLVQSDSDGVSEGVSLLFMKRLSSQNLFSILRSIQSVLDLLSEFLSFDVDNVSGSE